MKKEDLEAILNGSNQQSEKNPPARKKQREGALQDIRQR